MTYEAHVAPTIERHHTRATYTMTARNADRSNGDTAGPQHAIEPGQSVPPASARMAQLDTATQGVTFALLEAHADQVRERVMSAQRDVGAILPEQYRTANARLVREALEAVQLAKLTVRECSAMVHFSRCDAVTGTPDRAVMHDRLEQAVALARRRSSRIAVFFLDLDDFKRINDTLGHAAGDEALRLAARRLEAVVRDSDTVSRHGGDEFLVLLADVAQPPDAFAVARNMLSALAAPAQVGGRAVALSASLGVAVFPDDGEDADSLIARADAAMYRAKRAGGGAFRCVGDAAGDELPICRDSLADHPLDATGGGHGRGADGIEPAAAHPGEARAEAASHRALGARPVASEFLHQPLESIRQAAALLEAAHVDKALLGRLRGVIEMQLVRLSRLIDDMHAGMSVYAHAPLVPRGTVDLRDILCLAVARTRPTLAARRQVLTRQLAPGALEVHGDAVRLTQAFSRLLANASTHTPAGGDITLATREHADSVTVTVSDNGFGIVPDALPGIFETRLHDTYAMIRGNCGAGVGLAGVRDLIEAYGGTISVSSAGKDLGSTFVITVPKVAS